MIRQARNFLQLVLPPKRIYVCTEMPMYGEPMKKWRFSVENGPQSGSEESTKDFRLSRNFSVNITKTSWIRQLSRFIIKRSIRYLD